MVWLISTGTGVREGTIYALRVAGDVEVRVLPTMSVAGMQLEINPIMSINKRKFLPIFM